MLPARGHERHTTYVTATAWFDPIHRGSDVAQDDPEARSPPRVVTVLRQGGAGSNAILARELHPRLAVVAR